MYKIKQLLEDFIVEEIPSHEFQRSGRYTCFLLEKRNYNTETVIQKLAEKFKIPRKRFGYAGNKDKKAITKQYVSVTGKIKNIKLKDIEVKVIGYRNEPISLGDLKGNKFSIVVRNIKSRPKPIKFIINYFDEQRFGRFNLEIGLAILKKDFKKASQLIDSYKVKEHLENKPNDFVGALKKIPFKTLQLYLHSVQSWIWNETASYYVKTHSKKISNCKYKHGEFLFPDKIENVIIPLISFDTEFNNKEIKSVCVSILKNSGLSLPDFVIRTMPEITPMGNERELIADVMKLKTSNLEEDELNHGKKKVKISFELGKGSYATLVIKRIFSE